MNGKFSFSAIVLLVLTSPAVASVPYTGNPSPAYPPGCVTTPIQRMDLQGENVAHFYSGRIWLNVVINLYHAGPMGNLGEVQLDMYRVGCAEPNRSVIVAEFRLPPQWSDSRSSQLMLPVVAGVTGFDPYPLEFKPEANSWGHPASQYLLIQDSFGDYTGGWDDARRFTWRFVLDVSPGANGMDRDDAPKFYNRQFGLGFYRPDGQPFHSILVPATEAVLKPATSMPLSGRLSGHWIEEGSADQGLLLSFNALLAAGEAAENESSELLVFLSWYTFDQGGDMLWLTGAGRFAQGSSAADIEIELVDGGTFLGAAPAQRDTVGRARLRALNCGRLELEYELDDLGLGSDVMHLERPIALEIADYPCRDYEGLQSSVYPAETH